MTVRKSLLGAIVLIACTARGGEPSTAFTYQGQLKRGGVPVNATCRLDFSLWDAEIEGSELGFQVVDAEINHGLFTVKLNASSELGINAFDGQARWLEVRACCLPDDCTDELDFALLGRHEVTPTPYAIHAPSGAGGDGVWQLNGNDISYAGGNVGIGTAEPSSKLDVQGDVKIGGVIRKDGDTQIPFGLEFFVNEARALCLEHPYIGAAPNFISGHPNNHTVGKVQGVTIIGGGTEVAPNSVAAQFGTITGGYGNQVSGEQGTVHGGRGNVVSGEFGTVGGGQQNDAAGDWSAVPGGLSNKATGDYSFAAGRQAKAEHTGSFVWADSTGGDFASTQDDQLLIRAAGGVGIGTNAPTANLEVVTSIRTSRVGDPDQAIDITSPGNQGLFITGQSRENNKKNLAIQNLFDASGSAAGTNDIVFKNGSESAPVERMRIAGNGNVGIGTGSPAEKLHVNGSLRLGANSKLYGGSDSRLSIYTNSSSTDSRSWIELWGPDASRAGELALGGTYFTVRTGSNETGSAGTERVRITSGGNVGIGTTTAANRLDVEGGVAVGTTYSGTSAAPADGLIVQGNVGIGTTTTANKLDIKGGVAIGSTFAGTNPAPTNGLVVQGNVGIGTPTTVNKLDVEGAMAIGTTYSGTTIAPANGLIVEGNVGIGQTSPVAPLHVAGSPDATPSSGGAIVVGNVSSTNLAIDGNEIMARNNGSVATLNLNLDGGNVNIGSEGATTIDLRGNVTVNGSKPFRYRTVTLTTLAGQDSAPPVVVPNVTTTAYTCAIAGFDTTNGNIEEEGGGRRPIYCYTEPNGNSWYVHADFKSDEGDHESWTVDVLCVRKDLVD